MSATSNWQIGPLTGTLTDTASLGVSNISRRRASQTIDTLSFKVDGRSVDAPLLFTYGAMIRVVRAGTPWFVGRVTRTPATGTGRAHSQTYELSGPWWHLEHLACRQTWSTRNGAGTALLGRMILGQAIDGLHITTGAVMTEALQYAIDAGAPFTLGSILTGFTIPFDQVKDVTCAEVIRKMMRWHPDAVTWFDYSAGALPSINIEALDALGATQIHYGRMPLVSIGAITPRYDLSAPSVVIHYEITGSDSGLAFTDVVTDAAPTGSTGTEFGAVVLTIALRGSTATSVQQPVQIRPIVTNTADAGLVAYLSTIYAPLQVAAKDPSITMDGISITALSRALADPNAREFDPSNPGTPVAVEYDGSLSNELVQGAVTPWMGSLFAIKAQKHRMTFTYTLDKGTGDSDGADGTDGPDDTDKDVTPYTAAVDIVATNAITQNYTTLTNYDAGDVAPTGLAANYLATLNTLQWSGSVIFEEAVAGTAYPEAGMGSVLNISGSENAAWSTMNALIVDETIQAETGRTTLTFGPALHLTPQDLVSRLQTTRPGGTGGRESGGSFATADSEKRKTGGSSAGNSVVSHTVAASQNACPVPGGGALGPHWMQFITANGEIAYLQVNCGTPQPSLPADASAINS